MKETLEREVDGYIVPEGMMFAYSTRMADSWTPDIERILKPSYSVSNVVLTLSIKKGESTFPQNAQQWLPKGMKLKMMRQKALDLGDVLLFDTRGLYPNNIMHILQQMVTPVLFAQRMIDEELGLGNKISVVLPTCINKTFLTIFDLLDIPIIIWDGAVTGKVLNFSPTDSDGIVDYHSLQTEILRDGFIGESQDVPNRIYLSRRGARELVNENEVHQLLSNLGFERVYMEDHSFSEQWSMIKYAQAIVAVHGASLGSFPFRNRTDEKPGVKLLELFSAGYQVNCYREDVAVFDGRWAACRGKISPEIVRDLDFSNKPRSHANASFEIDLKSLCEALSYLEIT